MRFKNIIDKYYYYFSIIIQSYLSIKLKVIDKYYYYFLIIVQSYLSVKLKVCTIFMIDWQYKSNVVWFLYANNVFKIYRSSCTAYWSPYPPYMKTYLDWQTAKSAWVIKWIMVLKTS